MPKLTKQEINAVANKLHRGLEEKIRLERLRARHEYIPSADYMKIESLLSEIESISEQIDDLLDKKKSIGKKVNEIIDRMGIPRRYWNEYESCEAKEWLNKLIDIETKVPDIPSVEELKDEITIAAIDTDFNVEDYLESQLKKW